MRIYSAGLRPYGLYGVRWQNQVFYDLHATVLAPDDAGRKRLMAIIDQFEPDLILVSVEMDPAYEGPWVKPLERWMARQNCFHRVFSDPTVSAYRVLNGCAELINKHRDSLAADPIRMSG